MKGNVMTLEEIRKTIDAIDPQIRDLVMERMDCSRQVAEAKLASGDLRIYRADREEEILARLGEGVPAGRRAPYLALVRKIMETSRMYQYGLLFDAREDLFEPLIRDLSIPKEPARLRLCLTRPDRPGSMASLLGMVGDYGCNMETLLQLPRDRQDGKVSFELVLQGNIKEKSVQKLVFQLSMESEDFRIMEVL